ncbi:MAG TPA: class I SAM-dependent methyltransferase [Telluria sp.]|nr:class I SAM-dependent methyltransferase [Telluria sp.]
MSTDLDTITSQTLAHYNRTAASFFTGTIDHDVSQNIDALLRAITAPPPFTILDLGCGPGRDLKTFTELGHRAIGVDGAAEFVQMARDYSGCEVWHQDFLHLDLPASTFDGIFANASLFHVPKAVLPDVLKKLHAALKAGGVLFSSNPRGNNQEGWSGPRYGSYHDLDAWRGFLEQAGFTYVDHYYRPAGRPLAEQNWLASVWRQG